MYYGAIKKNDVADGPGVRVSLFVSGCRHHCEGCFQPETWNFTFGNEYTEETKNEILAALSPTYIEGITILGGEPFEPENQPEVCELLRTVKERYPNKNIWCYTGYTYDKDLFEGGAVFTDRTEEMLSYIDVLVDGEFVLAKRNLMLKFRGSENQRLIDVKASNKENVVLVV